MNLLTPPQHIGNILHSPTRYSKEIKMDSTKWKSVAVSIDNYKMLRQMAKENDRSISGQLAYIIKLLNKKEAA
jgi:hypothetical protein